MPGEQFPNPPPLGAFLVDTNRADQVGEFRGVTGPRWFLRPVGGGAGWDAEPVHLRLATPTERLHAENAQRNARSWGVVL